MKLKALAGAIPGEVRIIGNEDTEILALCADSREVSPGALFFCTPGPVSYTHLSLTEPA